MSLCVVLYFALSEAFKAPRCLDPSDKSMVTEAEPPTNGCEAAIEAFLASVEMGDPSAADHLCQMAAVMERLLGYGSIQPAYYSASIGRDSKTLQINGERTFTADIDLFNAEFHSVFGLFTRCRCVMRVD